MLYIPNFLYSWLPVNIAVPRTPIVNEIVTKDRSNRKKIIPRTVEIPKDIIKMKNENEETIGVFLLIRTTKLFPEPRSAIVEDTAAIPINKDNSPNFSGSNTPATKNQNAIPMIVPPMSPIPKENNPFLAPEFLKDM